MSLEWLANATVDLLSRTETEDERLGTAESYLPVATDLPSLVSQAEVDEATLAGREETTGRFDVMLFARPAADADGSPVLVDGSFRVAWHDTATSSTRILDVIGPMADRGEGCFVLRTLENPAESIAYVPPVVVPPTGGGGSGGGTGGGGSGGGGVVVGSLSAGELPMIADPFTHVASDGRTEVWPPFVAPTAGTVAAVLFFCDSLAGSGPDAWTARIGVQRAGSSAITDVASAALDPLAPPGPQSPLRITLPAGGIALAAGDVLRAAVDPGTGQPPAIVAPAFLLTWTA